MRASYLLATSSQGVPCKHTCTCGTASSPRGAAQRERGRERERDRSDCAGEAVGGSSQRASCLQQIELQLFQCPRITAGM